MSGLISFHPVEPAFFDEVVQPLVSGSKIDPEPYLLRALQHRVGSWATRRYIRTLDILLDQSTPPPPPTSGSRWEKLRARLEIFDFTADPLATLVKKAIKRDLHLLGRPFLIADGAPRVVAEVVDRYRQAETAGVVEQLVEAVLVARHELGEALVDGGEAFGVAREGDAGAGERGGGFGVVAF